MERRILLLVTDLEIGGTPTVVRELAVRLNRPPAVTVEVACLARWGPVADEIKAAGVAVQALGCTRAAQFPVAVGRLVRLLRRDRHDTVFSFLIHANAVAAAASRFCTGVRFLQSIQTTQPYPRWHWRLQSLVHRAAACIVVPSPSVAEFARARASIPRKKLVVIPNAVDPADFARSTVPAEDRRPYPIGFIGRLDPIKRVPALINAVGRLQGLVHLHVWGDGPDRPAIEDTMWLEDAYGGCKPEWVTLHGTTSRVHDVLQQIGLLVLPSRAEGFGLVLIEAMAAGVPVVATDVPGIRDVVRHGENGLLVDGEWPIGPLVDAIRWVVEDRALRDRLVAGGLAEVGRRFTWAHAMPAYRRVLNLS